MTAVPTRPAEVIFPFIRTTHPFYDEVRRLGEIVAGSTAFRHQVERESQGLPVAVHSEIKGARRGNGWALERFYHSIQFPQPGLPGGHYGWSLHFSAQEGLREVEFPEDPKLSRLRGFVDQAQAGSVRVLRYVPLRRVTFIQADASGQPAGIGKLKKPHRCQEGYQRLKAISSRADAPDLRIPEALGINDSHGVFLQELVPGEEITGLLEPGNHEGLLRQIGTLHARLNGVDASGLPRWDRDEVLAGLVADLDWIVSFMPEARPILELAAKRLLPWPFGLRPKAGCFCHGDFACSQILHHGSGWSVVDFDLAGVGDRYQDIAMFLVSLAYDVPLYLEQPHLLDAAREAYLAGYQAVGEPIALDVLQNYEACAVIYYLALILKKDRFSPTLGERALERLEHLLESRHD